MQDNREKGAGLLGQGGKDQERESMKTHHWKIPSQVKVHDPEQMERLPGM